MTRWATLLDALGVNAEHFELEHQSSFDLSPREWVRKRLEGLAESDDDDESELVDGLNKCTEPCCGGS